jgi:hypothetical protein
MPKRSWLPAQALACKSGKPKPLSGWHAEGVKQRRMEGAESLSGNSSAPVVPCVRRSIKGCRSAGLSPAAAKHANAGMVEQQEIHRLGAQTRSIPPQLQDLIGHWLQRCDGRAMPLREDFGHRDLRRWWGHLALFDVLDHSDFAIRLSGTNLIRRFGREATHLLIGELAIDIGRHLRDVLKAALKAEGPVIATSPVPLGRATCWNCDVAMPLASLENPRGMILFGSYPIAER